MAQYGFFFDNSRCTGCKTCELACSDYHDLPVGIAYRKVYDYEGGTTWVDADGICRTDAFAYHLSLACNHCAVPACTHVCPTTAMHKDPETGLVSVNGDVCIGCGYCTMACPYHAPAISSVTNKSAKCDGCASRLADGLAPVCVEACPVRALDFGEISVLAQRHPGCVERIEPMPAEWAGSPNIYILPSDAARVHGPGEGFVANVQENDYVRM